MNYGGLTRRGFLATAAITTSTAALSSRVTATQSRSVTGKVVDYSGSPVAGRAVYWDDYHPTDSDGRFEFSVEQEGIKLGFYKKESMQLHAPVKNNVPHIAGLGDYTIEEGGADLGEIQLPKAYTVDLRALNESGDPATNAEFGFGSGGFGSSSHWLDVNESGYLQLKNADFTGIELAGPASVTIKVPRDGPDSGMISYDKSLVVDSDKTVTARIGEGISVEDSQSSMGTTTTNDESTSSDSTTEAANTADETSTVTSTTGTTASTTTTNRPQRGLFSNGDSAVSRNAATDPFVITVGGFMLSVAGLAHNLLRGG